MTYKAVGRSIINYAAPVWSTNASTTSYRNIQTAQNAALRIITGSHLMSCVDHLHDEATILKVEDHSELLSAQYLVRCLEPDNVCHDITTREHPPRMMKNTLHTKHHSSVEPLMVADNRKKSLQAVHTAYVGKALNKQKKSKLLGTRPPPINNNDEVTLSRNQRTTLSQLRSGYCRRLGSYKSRINCKKKDDRVS